MAIQKQGRHNEGSSKEPHVEKISLHCLLTKDTVNYQTVTPTRRLHWLESTPETTRIDLKVIGMLTRTRYSVHLVQVVQVVESERPVHLHYNEKVGLCSLIQDILMRNTGKFVSQIPVTMLDLERLTRRAS